MASNRFVYIWHYTIDPVFRSDFLAAYNPKGEWAQLFSRDPAYLGTSLLEEADNENAYITIDYWRSKAERDSFRERCAIEFDDFDKKCEQFTKDERRLGDYIEVSNESGT